SVDDLHHVVGRPGARDGAPMDTVGAVGLGQPALRDEEVDHRRHLLRLEAPDDEVRPAQRVVRRGAGAQHAPLERLAHALRPRALMERKTPGAVGPGRKIASLALLPLREIAMPDKQEKKASLLSLFGVSTGRDIALQRISSSCYPHVA